MRYNTVGCPDQICAALSVLPASFFSEASWNVLNCGTPIPCADRQNHF